MGRDSTVDALVVDLLERVDGEESRVEEVLEELCARHPEEARELRASVRALSETGLLGGGAAENGSPLPERLGAFRPIARLGSGGMGVVHLAEQDGEPRLVALKALRPEQLWFEGGRARFQREVEAVALLEHPGIAAVHGVGEEQGVPYCALEFVPGASLEHVVLGLAGREPRELDGHDLLEQVQARLTELGLEETEEADQLFWAGTQVEVVLRIGLQLARALEHAHERGVLHRDVKPSNVVVTPGGRAALVDFGLASLHGAQRVTRTGAQLGSLPYMAPEQVEARSADVGPRTDVYGLGVTLYELLTLRLPFGEGAASEVRTRILAGVAPSVSRLNPLVAPDVATVVGRAMAVETGERYASAGEMARDLESVLSLRPIGARPPTVRLRLRRWARRRPALTTGLVLGLLFLVLGPAGWAAQLAWSRARIRQAFDAEQEARGRAERHRAAVLTALSDVLELREGLEDAPGVQAERLAALERAIAVYEGLEAESPDDLDVRRQGVRLYKARGDLHEEQGALDAALADYDRAGQRVEWILERAPGDVDALADRFAVRHQRARARYRGGSAEEARRGYESALSAARELVRFDDSAARRLDLATALANLAQAHRRLGDTERAAAAGEEGLAVVEGVLEEDAGDAAAWWTEASLRQTLANVDLGAPEAEKLLRRACVCYRRARDLEPGVRDHVAGLATAHYGLAGHLRRRGRLEEGLEELERCLALREDLRERYPSVTGYRDDLLATLNELALLRYQRGEVERAQELFLEQARERGALAAEYPSRGDLAVKAALAYSNHVGSVAQDGGDAATARASLGEATRLLEVARAAGTDAPTSERIAWTLEYYRGLLACHEGPPAEAEPLVSRFEARGGPSEARHLRFAADLWNELALSWRRIRESGGEERAIARAFELLGRAVEAGYDDVEELSRTEALEPYRARSEYRAILRRASGE